MNSPTIVVAVNGDTATIERPLARALTREWPPTIYAAASTISEVGVSGLSIEFPNTEYPGQFEETGFAARQVCSSLTVPADYGRTLSARQTSSRLVPCSPYSPGCWMRLNLNSVIRRRVLPARPFRP
ncbi:MAG: hypothetical protein ACI9C1_003959 [Candidatus Aldehydirespiratoraceae bacterium]